MVRVALLILKMMVITMIGMGMKFPPVLRVRVWGAAEMKIGLWDYHGDSNNGGVGSVDGIRNRSSSDIHLIVIMA